MGAAVMKEKQEQVATRKIELKVWIRAKQERVFKALTEAKDLDRWFLGNASTDPRPGGRFLISWSKDPAGKGCGDVESKFVDFVPHSKVSFLWSRKDELVTLPARARERRHTGDAAA
jgi:uncharacterized protein YndB with AHSA1/START domain